MEPANIVDDINKKTMHAAITSYSAFDELSPPERIALARIGEQVKGGAILDLGVGGGRTVRHLCAISSDYIGVDYVQGMVDACRGKFPGVRFEYADARSMPQFGDASFDLVVFAWAGICMVDHAGRLAILREVRRILRPGGYFIFSTYNQNCADHDAPFAFPDFTFSGNPLRLAVNTLNFVRSTVFGLINKQKLRRFEVRTSEYSIINDRCHDYATMLYYITFTNQLKQLAATGFSGAVVAYDTDGNELAGETPGNSFTFVVSG